MYTKIFKKPLFKQKPINKHHQRKIVIQAENIQKYDIGDTFNIILSIPDILLTLKLTHTVIFNV